MPGAGTDKTRSWTETPGPIIVLVEPQLGENIGAAARVMANFGLARLRLVKPRDGWPNLQATRSASGADRILDDAALFDTVEAAIADCTVVLATTARAHDQAKPVIGPDQAARLLAPHVAAGENVAVLFGRERYGLENDEVALADRIVTFPVNPAFASLNLAQAVALVAYEWFKLAVGGELPFAMPLKSEPAPQGAGAGLLRQSRTPSSTRSNISDRSTSGRPCWSTCATSSRACSRPGRTSRPLHGIVAALTEGRKGPARGGVLDGEEATALRALLAEYGEAACRASAVRCAGWRDSCDAIRPRPSARCGTALTKDRRFAGKGFKRQVPVGPHITDFVSFPLRVVIDLVPARESEIAAKTRADRRAWLIERDYRVLDVAARDVEADLGPVLDLLAQQVAGEPGD